MKIIVKDVNPCEKRMRVLHFHDFAPAQHPTEKIPCIIKLGKNSEPILQRLMNEMILESRNHKIES